MRAFKLPLIVTGIALVVVLIVGIAGVSWIHNLPITGQEKEFRAQKLGTGAATMLVIVVGPFWWIAAARAGKKRREARVAGRTPRR